MDIVTQSLKEIRDSLSSLPASGEDATFTRTVEELVRIAPKGDFEESDIEKLFTDSATGEVTKASFDTGLLLARLFLALSKDEMETSLRGLLSSGIGAQSMGFGSKRFVADQKGFVQALVELRLLEAMRAATNLKPTWSDILVERLRSGRGKAIRGQQRGRNLEDFVEKVIRDVFGDKFDTRCQFLGAKSAEPAKCDFAIPSKQAPRILIESKAYGATGSKMTDIIGDLNTIIRVKRHDTVLIFVTDGMTWNQRLSDLGKIVQMQNHGEILRVYTMKMADQFRADMLVLKKEVGL